MINRSFFLKSIFLFFLSLSNSYSDGLFSSEEISFLKVDDAFKHINHRFLDILVKFLNQILRERKETKQKGKIMNKTNSSLLESFIETIESSKKDRERWLKKVGQCGLEQTLGEYYESQQIDQYRISNDQAYRNE